MKVCFAWAVPLRVAVLTVLVSVISLIPADAALAVTFVVESAASDPDADLSDGICASAGGICTWSAAQNEVQGGIHSDFIIEFLPGLAKVPSGRFAGTKPGMSVAIQGPIEVDLDALPRNTRGLYFLQIANIQVEDVWINGNGTIGDFDASERAIVYETLSTSSCTIHGNYISGVHTPFVLGNSSLDIPCTITNNAIGFTRAGAAVGNERGIVVYADTSDISGNTVSGVQSGFVMELWGDGNTVSNNNFGTDPIGLQAFPNASLGVYVNGDLNDFEGNVFSNSLGRGLELRGSFNDLYRNRVGTNVQGEDSMGNSGYGIFIQGDDNCVGVLRELILDDCAMTPELEFLANRNVVSNNGEDGIYISSGDRNVLLANTVGTDRTGSVALGNLGHGIHLSRRADETVIFRGIVSANHKSGINLEEVVSAVVDEVLVGGAYFGAANLGNLEHGIRAYQADTVIIGDALGAGNTIVGNGLDGIRLQGDSGGSTSGVIVANNWIGSDALGNALPNANGIAIVDTVSFVDIEDNSISGNRQFGIHIRSDQDPQGSRPRFITITGNLIGVGPAPSPPALARSAVPNAWGGIYVSAGSELESFWPEDIEIGLESLPGFLDLGNLISGNGGPGVWIAQGGGDISLVANFIGVDENMAPIPNAGLAGVVLEENAGLVVIGDIRVGGGRVGNVISANLGSGIWTQADGGVILSNFIGTDDSGEIGGITINAPLGIGNRQSGIEVAGADAVIIGGAGQSTLNVIAGNFMDGIRMRGSTGSTISGNWIGTSAPPLGGAAFFGNLMHGISISRDSAGNLIEGNSISFNLADGVQIQGGGSVQNWIRSNSIFSNARLGIELLAGGNQEIPVPTVSSLSLQSVVGTTCSGCVVEIFSDDLLQGRTLETTVDADGSGNFSAAGPFAGPIVTCTTYDAESNTSMFGCGGIANDPLQGLSVTKRVFDLDGDDVEPGDLLIYEIELSNQSPNDFEDIALVDELEDVLPTGIDYEAGSLTVDGLANDDDLGDGIGFDNGPNAILWNGTLPSGANVVLAFEVSVDPEAVVDSEIANQARFLAAGSTINGFAAGFPSDDPDTAEQGDATVVVVGQPVPEPNVGLLQMAAILALAARRRLRRGHSA